MRKNSEHFNEKEIIERVRLVRAQHAGGRGKSKFARDLGISPSTYSYYESDRVPPIEVLLKISQITGADLEWLLTGQAAEKKSPFRPGSALFEKLEELFAHSPQLVEPISAFVDLLSDKQDMESKLQSELPASKAARPGWIPVLGRTAAGLVHFWEQTSVPEPKQAVTELDELVAKHVGKPIVGSVDKTVSIDLDAGPLLDGVQDLQVNLIRVSGHGDEQIVEFVECEQIHKLFGDSFALHIDGDSMSPRINDGDIVILSPSVPAAQGHVAVAQLENQIGVTCKLIRTTETQVHLIPINERYEAKVVPKKDLLWALAVLGHVSI